MPIPRAPRGTCEERRGNTTFDVDDQNVIVSRVVTDGRGTVTDQTRDAMRELRGEN
jgi:hypothetical protein